MWCKVDAWYSVRLKTKPNQRPSDINYQAPLKGYAIFRLTFNSLNAKSCQTYHLLVTKPNFTFRVCIQFLSIPLGHLLKLIHQRNESQDYWPCVIGPRQIWAIHQGSHNNLLSTCFGNSFFLRVMLSEAAESIGLAAAIYLLVQLFRVASQSRWARQ